MLLLMKEVLELMYLRAIMTLKLKNCTLVLNGFNDGIKREIMPF